MRKSLIAILLTAMMIGCANQERTPEAGGTPRQAPAAPGATVDAANRFGLKLFRALYRDDAEVNIILSPLSISTAMAMVLQGADGATRDSIAATLGLKGIPPETIAAAYHDLLDRLGHADSSVKIEIANSIWVRNDLTVEEAFVDSLRRNFEADVRRLDFHSPDAAETINDWVKDATRGTIGSIVPDRIPDGMVMYLLDAIYFNGGWSEKFSTDKTRDADFMLRNGGTTTAELMYRQGTFAYRETDMAQVVELPYGDSLYSMIVLLPRDTLGGIDALISHLSDTTWRAATDSLRPQQGEVFLPRFELDYERALSDPLGALGMSLAFSDRADFTGIRREGGLAVSEVRHKAYIDVDEEGTEASAATSVGVTTTAMPLGFIMRCDRPFLFAIRERGSGAILFLGLLADPTA